MEMLPPDMEPLPARVDEPEKDALHKVEGYIVFCTRVLFWLAGAGLMVMTALIVADVIGIKILSRPVPGGIEWVSFMAVVAIAFAVPYTQVMHGHVAVDFIVDMFPRRAKLVVEVFTGLRECRPARLPRLLQLQVRGPAEVVRGSVHDAADPLPSLRVRHGRLLRGHVPGTRSPAAHQDHHEGGSAMDPVTIGIIGVAALVVLFLLGMPVGFTMGLVGVVGFAIVKGADAGLGLLARDFWDIWSSYNLTVIPMFVFMGSVAFYAGMSGRLYQAAYILFGRWRGGLAMATVVATAGFSAICGSTSATAAAMGKVAIPEMRRYGYDPGLACGCMAAAGSLGIMIPPSTIFIIYGILSEQSIGKLFVAGVVPGLILATFFIIAIYIWTLFKPTSAPAGGSTTMKEKLMGLTGLIEMLFLFALVIGGLFAGLFSPTQAAGVGTAAAILIGVVRRSLDLKRMWLAIKDTLLITAMIMTIVAGATVFGHFMAVTGIPGAASDFLSGLPVPPTVVMILIIWPCI